ncbi:hypothetical protein SSS_10076, partial [Sarcoptes scabiei]
IMIVLFQRIASYVSFFNKIQLRKNFFNQGEELKNMPRFHLSVDGYWLRFFLFSMLSSYFNVLWWWSLFLSLSLSLSLSEISSLVLRASIRVNRLCLDSV